MLEPARRRRWPSRVLLALGLALVPIVAMYLALSANAMDACGGG